MIDLLLQHHLSIQVPKQISVFPKASAQLRRQCPELREWRRATAPEPVVLPLGVAGGHTAALVAEPIKAIPAERCPRIEQQQSSRKRRSPGPRLMAQVRTLPPLSISLFASLSPRQRNSKAEASCLQPDNEEPEHKYF